MQSVTPLNQANNSQNFYPADGDWKIERLPFTASVAITDGAAVGSVVSASNPTGNLSLMPTSQATGQNFVGILMEKINTTDADYATAGKLKSVLVPTSKRAKAFFSVGAGTFTAADVGRVCLFHTDSKSLNVDGNGAGAQIVGIISSTQGLCTFDVPLVTTA